LIRRARIADVKAIYRIITEQAEAGRILPRAMSELYSQVRSFIVSVDGSSEDIIGCGALEICWEDLAEIRSLAVKTSHQGGGIGSLMIRALLEDAQEMGVQRVFVLTYRPSLFERHGFKQMDKGSLPHKIWADCLRCAKFPECDEIALVRST